MHFSFKSFLIIIFIFSCSSEVDKGIEANLLISPDYNFSIEFFECNLNAGYTLLNLESFLSDLTRNEKSKNNDVYDLEVFFPKSNYVNEFILNLKTYRNDNTYNNFINELSAKGFDEIARCKFDNNNYQGKLLIDYKTKQQKYNNEILRCNYNDGFNFGTFRVAIDRFINQIQSLNIPYDAIYIQSDGSPRSFIWINNFYSNEPADVILSDWLDNAEAKDIKEEFLENAKCINADMHDVFVLKNN
tara:strand:+ start:1216 stop:1950 length:735 start_codon:yes stop_codon:yes gene_type:complete